MHRLTKPIRPFGGIHVDSKQTGSLDDAQRRDNSTQRQVSRDGTLVAAGLFHRPLTTTTSVVTEIIPTSQ